MCIKCMHVILYYTYAAKDTLPRDILIPTFSGNADYVDSDDLFAPRESRREMWVRNFPRLERPSDELANNCLLGILIIMTSTILTIIGNISQAKAYGLSMICIVHVHYMLHSYIQMA